MIHINKICIIGVETYEIKLIEHLSKLIQDIDNLQLICKFPQFPDIRPYQQNISEIHVSQSNITMKLRCSSILNEHVKEILEYILKVKGSLIPYGHGLAIRINR